MSLLPLPPRWYQPPPYPGTDVPMYRWGTIEGPGFSAPIDRRDVDNDSQNSHNRTRSKSDLSKNGGLPRSTTDGHPASDSAAARSTGGTGLGVSGDEKVTKDATRP